MTFKNFYYSNKDNKFNIFESVFEKYYSKGYFGKLDRQIIKEQQMSWFKKFLLILEENDKDTIKFILNNRDNVMSREWFSQIYKEDIVEKSRHEIEESVEKAIK